jgi:nucleolar GTP-binding protein
MVVYNFKEIRAVSSAEAFVDIVLSKTQRKTPTVVHPGYKISRIRAFYMRKVKFTQENFNEKITWILEDFPRLDDIHPFYADLCNVLYDRDHYKLALGQLNVAKNLLANISKDYVGLLKYGDSLYRCKQLKRAALGRMCTLMKKQKSSLAYLEEVRKHLSRLPSIDPNTRTLLVTGYPNVGKSSFVNKVTRADVEVQPYAFTTKSLFVGHLDYKYLRWQVLDTPGILDKPLEDRNTIEMQAITALAHLQCAVLYFMDLSETCGWNLEEQAKLFDNIRPLFANKPLVIVANKTDLVAWDDLETEKREMIEELAKTSGATLLQMSSVAEEGIAEVKQRACDLLLSRRVEIKLKSKKLTGVLDRIQVTVPKPRDARPRDNSVPESVLARREARRNGTSAMDEDSDDDVDMAGESKKTTGRRRTERDLMWENGGPGVYSADFTKQYLLKNPEQRHDTIPEIMDGKNIADFVDPDIERKLAELEKEEDELLARAELEAGQSDEDSELDEEEVELVEKIRDKRGKLVRSHRAERNRNYPIMPRKGRLRTIGGVKKTLEAAGYDAANVAPEVSRGRKRNRSQGPQDGQDHAGDSRGFSSHPRTSKSRAASRDRSESRARRSVSVVPGEGFADVKMKIRAAKMMKLSQGRINLFGKAGEADRHIAETMPKYLYVGKRGAGKTNRR